MMLQAHVTPELGVGFMTTAMWNGNYDATEQGDYVFYRDLGTRDVAGKPERELLPTRVAVSVLMSFYSDRDDEYVNLLAELRDVLDDEEYDYSIPTSDLRRKLAAWLESEATTPA